MATFKYYNAKIQSIAYKCEVYTMKKKIFWTGVVVLILALILKMLVIGKVWQYVAAIGVIIAIVGAGKKSRAKKAAPKRAAKKAKNKRR